MKNNDLKPGQRFRFIEPLVRPNEHEGQAVIVNERGVRTLRWVDQKTFEIFKFHPDDKVELT